MVRSRFYVARGLEPALAAPDEAWPPCLIPPSTLMTCRTPRGTTRDSSRGHGLLRPIPPLVNMPPGTVALTSRLCWKPHLPTADG